jgi:hypothetical protein
VDEDKAQPSQPVGHHQQQHQHQQQEHPQEAKQTHTASVEVKIHGVKMAKKKLKAKLADNGLCGGLVGLGNPKNGVRSAWFDTQARASAFVDAFNQRLAIVEGVRATLTTSLSETGECSTAGSAISAQLRVLSEQVNQLMKQTKGGGSAGKKTPGKKKPGQKGTKTTKGKVTSSDKKQGVCYFYSRFGNCKFGANCNREHVERVTNPHEKKNQFQKKVTQVTGGAVPGPQASQPPLGGPPFYQKANSSNVGNFHSPHHYHPPQFWGSPATPAFQNGNGDGYHSQRPNSQYWQQGQFSAGHYNPQWGTGTGTW